MFKHGLGDHLMAQILLKHLRHYHPEAHIAIVGNPGSHTVFNGLADEVFPLMHPMPWKHAKWDAQLTPAFLEPKTNYLNIPNTKTTKCLFDEFGLIPIPNLFKYEMNPTNNAIAKGQQFTNEVGKPFVLIHGFSECNKKDKSLNHDSIDLICRNTLARGLQPVVCDLGLHFKRQEGIKYLDRNWRGWGEEATIPRLPDTTTNHQTREGICGN